MKKYGQSRSYKRKKLNFHRNQTDFNRRADELENHIFSQLDSRLDKLEQKLTNKK